MSLKKLALIALIVVMLLTSVVMFGCKGKKADENATDTTMTAAPVDTAAAPAMDTTATPATTPAPAPAKK